MGNSVTAFTQGISKGINQMYPIGRDLLRRKDEMEKQAKLEQDQGAKLAAEQDVAARQEALWQAVSGVGRDLTVAEATEIVSGHGFGLKEYDQLKKAGLIQEDERGGGNGATPPSLYSTKVAGHPELIIGPDGGLLMRPGHELLGQKDDTEKGAGRGNGTDEMKELMDLIRFVEPQGLDEDDNPIYRPGTQEVYEKLVQKFNELQGILPPRQGMPGQVIQGLEGLGVGSLSGGSFGGSSPRAKKKQDDYSSAWE